MASSRAATNPEVDSDTRIRPWLDHWPPKQFNEAPPHGMKKGELLHHTSTGGACTEGFDPLYMPWEEANTKIVPALSTAGVKDMEETYL